MAGPPGALQELDSLLQSLQALKPPGVNKTKVESITKICTSPDNISKQGSIVDIIVKNFNRSPPTHKLGVMYIVDSVTRQWKAAGTTWSAGINKMTDVFPGLMNNLIPVAPDPQKEKISKLLDIWISSKTFPDHLLTGYKASLNAPTQTPTSSTQGLPQNASSNGQYAQQAPNGTNGAAPQASVPTGGALFASLGNVQQQAGLPLQLPGAQSGSAVISPPVNTFAPTTSAPAAQAPASNQNAFATLLNAATPAATSTNLASQLQILQELAPKISPEQLAGVIKALGIPLPPFAPQSGAVPPPPFPSTSAHPVPAQMPAPETSSQYRGGNDDRSRARSRSPDYNRGRYSPPNRRDSPTYGPYDPSAANNSSSQADHDRRGRGKGRGYRNEYRQRTPPPMPRDRPVSPAGPTPSNMPKPIAFDPKLPHGKIKVLSRTLFVGGVSTKTNETELKNFFSEFGKVQSCIVNHDKRHAFLKLITHQDAIATKQTVEMLPPDEYRGMFERIGWAVGFGPTSCADYKEGLSTIPINVLTDADRKWMLHAEYGGTGGKAIESGMIVEEPDIEIGAGPSSKAISRRGGGQSGGRGGGNFNRRGYERNAPYRKTDDRRHAPPPAMNNMPEPNTLGPPPAVPTFGAPIPGLPLNFR